jgi:signal transduction histidine kinase
MHLPRTADVAVADSAPAPTPAGLVAAAAVPAPSAPDRVLLRQFLRELRLPLAAIQSLLELAQDGAPESVQLAVRAAANHADHLLDFVADYQEHERLGAESGGPRPERVELVRWLDACLATQRHELRGSGVELKLQHRSFLPSHADLDGALAARAIDAVLRVATQRALPGPVDVRVAYAFDRRVVTKARLTLAITTRGGGFGDLEQGYVFEPFAVRDAIARPLLGLGVAQRLCQLLGGDVRVASPGPSACTYELSLHAPPCADARWTDPTGGSEQPFGAVFPRPSAG